MTDKPADEKPYLWPKNFGKNNKIFTEEAANKAKERLKKKLAALNTPRTPEADLREMLLIQVEEENPDLYCKLRQNPTEELEPFVRMQVEAAQQAYQWSIDSGMRPDEAREVEREFLIEYPVYQMEPGSDEEEFDAEMAEALISLYR